MEDLKKKINFDPALLYFSTTNKNDEEDVKNPITNTETYNSTNRKYICAVCGKRFFTNNSLTTHMEHHTPDEQVNAKDKDDNWKDRLIVNKGISCNKAECNFIALDAVEYQKHHASCEGKRVVKDENAAFCEPCENYFSSEDHLKAHSVLAHENCSDISLQEDKSKQTVTDPVCLYVSENDSGSKNNLPSKYPDSSVSKKKSKEIDTENESSESCRKVVTSTEDRVDVISEMESSSILNTVALDSDACDRKANESDDLATINHNLNEADSKSGDHNENANSENGNDNIPSVSKNLEIISDITVASVIDGTNNGIGEISDPSQMFEKPIDSDVNLTKKSSDEKSEFEVLSARKNCDAVSKHTFSDESAVSSKCTNSVSLSEPVKSAVSLESATSEVSSKSSNLTISSDSSTPTILSESAESAASSESTASAVSSECVNPVVSFESKQLVHSSESAKAAVPPESTKSPVSSVSTTSTVSSVSTTSADSAESTSFVSSESTNSAVSSESSKPAVSCETTKSDVSSECTESAVSSESTNVAVSLVSTESAVSLESTNLAFLSEVATLAIPSKPAESAVASESAKAAVCSESMETVTSSESINVAVSSESVETAVPSKPTKSVVASESVKATVSSEFTTSVSSSESASAGVSEPAKSTIPSKLTKSAVASECVKAPASSESTKSVAVSKSTTLAFLSKSAESTDPSKPTKLTVASESVKATTSSEALKSDASCESTTSTVSSKSAEAAVASKSVKATTSSESTKSVASSESTSAILSKSVKSSISSKSEKSADSSQSSKSVSSSESTKMPVSAEPSKSVISSDSTNSAGSSESAKSVEESYNGIEEMMYEMFKESDTSAENDADPSSPKTGNEKIDSTELELDTDYDIKKELLSPTKASKHSPTKDSNPKTETTKSNASIIEDLSDFKYERQPIKKKYLKSYSRQSQVKTNSDNNPTSAQSAPKEETDVKSVSTTKGDSGKTHASSTPNKKSTPVPSSPKEHKSKHNRSSTPKSDCDKSGSSSSSIKKSAAVPSITKESKSKHEDKPTSKKDSGKVHVESSPKKKSTVLPDIPKERKSKQEDVPSPKKGSDKAPATSSPKKSSTVQNISEETKPKQEDLSTPKKYGDKSKVKTGEKKSAIAYSAPKENTHVIENPSAQKITTGKGDKSSVNKSNISNSSVTLNINERSIRARKKLILPDFEYGFDMKAENDDFGPSISKRKAVPAFQTSTPSSASKTSEDSTVRKRGRPRKSDILPQTAKKLKTDVECATPKAPESTTASQEDSESDEAEEFSLTATVVESENDASEALNTSADDSQRPDEDSWLNKIDFSEQSVLDAWDEPKEEKKKKRGRPRKYAIEEPDKKSTEDLENVEEQQTKSIRKPVEKKIPEKTLPKQLENIIIKEEPLEETQSPEKKKRGRPRKIPTEGKSPVEDKSPVKLHVVSDESDEEVAKSSESSLTKSQTKKRGRPLKAKRGNANESSSKISDSTVSIFTEKESEQEAETKSAKSVSTITAAEPEFKSQPAEPELKTEPISETSPNSSQVSNSPPKKRGRPRKSLDNTDSKSPENTDSKSLENVDSKSLEISNSSPEKMAMEENDAPVVKEENTNESDDLKRRREFMQYIRIKDDTNDPDKESKQKNTGESSTSDSSVKKRGRPRKSPQKAEAASSTKHDRPYSIYNKYEAHAQNLLKRKQDPARVMKMKKAKSLPDTEEQAPKEDSSQNENLQVADGEKKETSEPQETASETAAESKSNATDESPPPTSESAIDPKPPEVKEKPVKRRKIKKSTEEAEVPAAEEKDETINIDPDLYYADMKNKSKYSKVFRKVTEIPKHDEYFPDSLVTCGRCKKLMTLRHYHQNHQASHYFVTWLEGEQEIDLNQDSEVTRIMQQAVNPDAIRKKCIRLACEKCDKIMKSVVGYVSHVRFCSKMDETEFLGTCVLCGKRLKPSSLRHHYVKFHGISQPNVNATSKDDLILDNSADSVKSLSSVPMKLERKNYLKGFERTTIQKNDIIDDEQFWTSLKTSYGLYMCMGLSCRHMTVGKEDLKVHILNCGALFCEFRCVSCPYKTKYESAIIYHSKNFCKDSSDTEEKPEDKVSADGRRTSTRVKKRSFRFDDDYSDEDRKESRKKRKTDSNFEVSEEDEDGDDDLNFETDTDDDITEKKSRFNKRKSDASSVALAEESGLRQAFLYHSSTRNYDPLNWAIEIRLRTFSSCSIHESLNVNINEWETFPISDWPKHSPEQCESMKIAFNNEPFTQFTLFQSEVVKGVPVCYTGGPVWAMSWAPLPASVAEQYLAVAGLKHMNHVVEINAPIEFPSLVQIWRYSSLDNISNDIHTPALAWAIAHRFGAVWCMEWCPSGGFNMNSDPCRLGILALATSSGCVVVYSVPKLDCAGESRNIVANPEPDLILKVRSDSVQCTRIVWQRNAQFNTICGGFTDGTIAFWNISTTSSILKKGKKIYPFRTFEAHNSSITALDLHWIDNGRFMLTSSMDRTTKYWDLDDLSGPLYEQERTTPALNVAWMHHWIVTANASDFVSTSDFSAFISHPRDIEKKKTISTLRDAFWSVAYSDWNDMVAISSNGGQVAVYAAKYMPALCFKQPDFEQIVTQTVILPLNDEEKKNSESVESSIDLPDTKNFFNCTSVIQNNGLKFCDRVKSKSSSEKLSFSPEQGSVASINKICWNQNYNSFNWLAVGYECGIVRVIRVERFDKHHLTKLYKMNENNSITLL